MASPREALERLVGRGALYTFGLAVQMLTALLVVPIVTRLLPAASYGRVAAGLVVYTVLTVLAGAGLPDAAPRTYLHDADGPRAARRLTAAVIFIAIAVAVVAELTGPAWAGLFGMGYGGVLRLAVWGAAAAAVTMCAQSLLRAADRPWAFLAVSAIGTVTGQALGLGLTAVLHSPTAYMSGIVIAALATAGAALLLTGVPRDGIAGWRELRQGLRVGLPIVPHGLSVYLLASADRIVIAAVLGLTAVGRYQVAYAVGGLGVALITALNQAWVPMMLGAQAERRWEILAATSKVVYALAGLVASVIALLTPLALLFAAPASYHRSTLVPVAAIVAFAALPYATCSTYFQIVLLHGRTRVMAIAAPLAATLNIGLNFLLLPAIGLVGASVATVAAYGILPLVVAVRSRRIIRLEETSRAAIWAWLVSAPFVAAGALLPTDASGSVLRLAAGVVAAIACYLLVRGTTPGLSRLRPTAADGRRARRSEAVADPEVVIDGAPSEPAIRVGP